MTPILTPAQNANVTIQTIEKHILYGNYCPQKITIQLMELVFLYGNNKNCGYEFFLKTM